MSTSISLRFLSSTIPVHSARLLSTSAQASFRSIERVRALPPLRTQIASFSSVRLKPTMSTSANDIPTLSELYAQGALPLLAEGEKPEYPHDESLNQRVSIWRGEILELQSDLAHASFVVMVVLRHADSKAISPSSKYVFSMDIYHRS
jgi:hypothetical protein